jgi:hypothetical protein
MPVRSLRASGWRAQNESGLVIPAARYFFRLTAGNADLFEHLSVVHIFCIAEDLVGFSVADTGASSGLPVQPGQARKVR